MGQLRKIVTIDETKCDGCGLCISSCHEGAIRLVDGKAKLVSDSYCDGLGACLGECPQGAIAIVEREALPFDEALVAQAKRGLPIQPQTQHPSPLRIQRAANEGAHTHAHAQGGCPGAAMRELAGARPTLAQSGANDTTPVASALTHWPVQLMLVPPHAPFLHNADLVVCADCVPFTVPDFHARYLRNRAIVVGCPKLDDLAYYADKLTLMLQQAQPRRLTVVRMEVPCCGGIVQAAVKAALSDDAQNYPIEEHIVSLGGEISTRVVRAGDVKTNLDRALAP